MLVDSFAVAPATECFRFELFDLLGNDYNVFIPYLTVEKLPDPDTVANAVSEVDAYADEIKLLYVAATRSRYGVYMTYSGTLSPLFPEGSDSYDFHDMRDWYECI